MDPAVNDDTGGLTLFRRRRWMRDSGAVDNKSYTPLLFYMDSAVNYPGTPILKGNKSSSSSSTPLSLYTTMLVSHPAPPAPTGKSNMDICVTNEIKFEKRKNHPLMFYADPKYCGRLRITYFQLSNGSFAVSKSSCPPSYEWNSESKVSFGSQSSGSKSKSKVSFRSFGSQSSGSKSKSKVSFRSFGSQSSDKPQSSKSKVSRNNIPEEVAFYILSKLSIKSLKRFGCVRKSWSVLFENTDFMARYNKHFISLHGSDDDYHTFIFANHSGYNSDVKTSEFSLLEESKRLSLPSPFQSFHRRTCIIGSTSVNGILCLGQFCHIIRKSLYVMWNPLTQESMVVPPSPAELVPLGVDEERSMEYCFHGFGYDQLRDDFKVFHYVSFEYFGGCLTIFLEIYSLKTNSWRLIHMEDDLCPCGHTFISEPFHGHEVYLDGACHWLVARKINRQQRAMSLLSFDLSDEVFLTTPIGVENISPYTHFQRLTVLNGSIALISNYHEDIVFHISILGELGVNESWTKLYIYGPLPSIQRPPIGFGKMGYMFFENNDYKVVRVDLSTQIIEEIDITGKDGSAFFGGLYKESLLSIGVSSN